MGTIGSIPGANALALLTAPGAPLSNSSLPQSILDSENPTDLAAISKDASALSETSLLYDTTTSDLFQTTENLQAYNPTLSLVDAAYGFTSAGSTTATPDLLQEALNNLYGTSSNSATSNSATSSANSTSPSTLNQSVLSLYGLNPNTVGSLIDTTG
jgi:hypothetical protein